MPEYMKMKNAELETLLKNRGLPSTGKKAEMVERLTKADGEKKTVEAPATTASSTLNTEDEIDWSDGEDLPIAPAPVKPVVVAPVKPVVVAPIKPVVVAPAKPVIAAPVKPVVAASAKPVVATSVKPVIAASAKPVTAPPVNPQAVPNQVAAITPATTNDLTVKAPGEDQTDEKKAPAPDFTRGLAATELDKEIAKRKARAEKFGLNVEEDEGLKKLERAQKFGESGPPKGLDEALPQRRKRGREDNNDGGRNKRRGNDRRGGGDRRGDGNRDGGDRRRNNNNQGGGRRQDTNRNNRSGPGGSASWMSEADRAKAEARKNKWATPAAATAP
ncbi:hypothetical protein BDV95DRAFT_558263 [Massariosphaeria phaeospora]|uniref:SAP domain-containing protein n=1 Tax=Massariosphaeria phaeospora TaxID=100035 RepID=A0A7C8MMH1_9PLEO|nr:hypothetical protein BDV95DRAFT_558263 [Massariosphaeria phaeospora]